MKKSILILFIIITLIFEIVFTVLCVREEANYKNDAVRINELTKAIESNYNQPNNYPTVLEYVVIDDNENVVYKTRDGLSTSLNEAYKNRDTIVDFSCDNGKKGKIIIYNNFKESIAQRRKIYTEVIIAVSCIQLVTFIIYYIYLYRNVLKPFKKMNNFATRISNGNLDIPLDMDRNNNFGAFTEAFDIMRTEILKARNAEKKANEAKKELVAKLSHDIKTPISSIKSYSELGLAMASEEKSKEYFKSINNKSDQMNIMITNLFNSTLQELEELKMNPSELNSDIVEKLINNADYLGKNKSFEIPKCNIYADKLRLQQIFDNIFSNSYKYANTDIETKAYIENDNLVVAIRDFGNSVDNEEFPLLTEKFVRGKNSNNIDGTGLGLYISSELLKKMNGELEIINANPGFKVLVYLRII